MTHSIDPKHPDPVDVHVGTRVRTLRMIRNMTQTKLANQIGISFQQTQKYETGANRISASKLYTIAQVLGVEPGYFFEGLDTPEGEGGINRLDLETTRIATKIARLPEGEKEAVKAVLKALDDKSAEGAA